MNDTAVVGGGARWWLLAAASVLVAAVALGLCAASPARASYGGVGPVNAALEAGFEGKAKQIDVRGEHSFAVDERTGAFFVADTYWKGEQQYAHLQEFSSSGSFVGQESIKLPEPTGITPVEKEEEAGERVTVGGLAVDPEAEGGERVYLLLVRERPDEEELGHVTRNPEAPAAAELYAFSTAVEKGKLADKQELLDEKTLKTFEEGKGPLLFPQGIAVDPKTHDVLILARQNESTSPPDEEAEEEEFELTVAQRVHQDGALGPRYVDAQDCLYAHEVPSEPECELDGEEFGSSVIVTSGGRVLVQDWGEAIWEVPAPVGSSPEGFKEVAVLPRHIYTVTPPEEPYVLEGEASFYNGGAMSFIGTSATEGRIYLDARYNGGSSSGKAVAVLHLSEAGGHVSVTELGWTGGQPSSSTQANCVVPEGPDRLAASEGETVLVLSPSSEPPHVLKFGPGGEACGNAPEVSAPSVSSDVSQIAAGGVAALSSTIAGAYAISEHWMFRYRETGGSWQEETPVQTSYELQDATSLEHVFTHVGEYEVTETVDTDDLSYPQVTAPPAHLKTVPGLAVAIAHPEAAVAGKQLVLQAALTGSEETAPKLTYVWSFGDGTSEEGSVEGAHGAAELGAQHTYAAAGTYTITLEVKGHDGQSAKSSLSVEVAPQPARSTTSGSSSTTSGSSSSNNGTASQSISGTLPFIEASLAPTLTGLAESHSSWRAGSKEASFSRARQVPLGTTFSLVLNEAARVSFAFDQKLAGRKVAGRCVAQTRSNVHKAPCRRQLARGTLAFGGHAGANKLAFDGRLAGAHGLAPGSYEVLISAESAGGRRSSTATLSFTIVK